MQGGNEIPTSIQAVLRYQGLGDFAGTISDEIGGGNGIQPMIVAAEMGKPVLDADLMGRAYPNVCLFLCSGGISIEMRVISRCINRKSHPRVFNHPRLTLHPPSCSLPGAYNIPNGLAPCAISDGIGNTIVIVSPPS